MRTGQKETRQMEEIWMRNDFRMMSEKDIRWGMFPAFEEAGFLTACSCRSGGDSDIVPGTLNLALHVGDDSGKVLENRRRFAGARGLDPAGFTCCQQVHGSEIAVVHAKDRGRGGLSLEDTFMGIDALVTDVADLPLLLFYADCVPVLLADPVTGAMGLAHAGWRGTAAGIAAKTVRKLEEVYGARPENLLAAIGPSIGPCCYEVDDFVKERMPEAEECFLPKGGGKYMLDLWKTNRLQLERAGVDPARISVAAVCTADNSGDFCSYRTEGGKTGRMGVCLCKNGPDRVK